MVYWLLHWVVSALALWITASIIPGIRLKSFSSALTTTVFIGIASFLVRPALLFLAFPINILTLGLFTFVVDGAILKLCASFLKNFKIASWTSAIMGAVLLSITRVLLHLIIV